MPVKKGDRIPIYSFRADYEQLGFEIQAFEDFLKKYPDEEKVGAHRIRFYAILFVTAGKGKHYIDFEPYRYKKGTLLFIGKGQAHAWSTAKNTKGYVLFFTEEFLYKNQIQFNDLSYAYPYNSILYSPSIDTVKTKDFQTLSLLTSLLKEEYGCPQKKLQTEVLQCLLRVLVLKLQANNATLQSLTSTEKETFISFQKELDKNIVSTRNAKDYCNRIAVSYHTLNQVVKKATGKTTKAFIDETLVLQSKRLLADRSKNVNEVSYELGFEEPSNFIKFFKKYTGKTPKQFADGIAKPAS